MMENKLATKGHLAALFSILVWGTTFVSTKVLLESFSPIEILLLRFAIGTLGLILLRPKRLRMTEKRHHLYFIGAGITGVTLYYLMENIALTYTTASNVGIIVSVSPLFTAIVMRLVWPQHKLRWNFIVGFLAAVGGIALISLTGNELKLDPRGDLLAVLAALAWAFYSILIRKIGSLGYDNILATRRVFCWGLVFMAPAVLLMGFAPPLSAILQPVNLGNILYLGVCASMLCFLTWNFSVKALGSVKASAYIYAVPVVTVVSSALVLKERITATIAMGILLTLVGLIISELQLGKNKEKVHSGKAG